MDRLTKPKDFLEKLGLSDCDYQDSGMINHIADLLERYHAEQLRLGATSTSKLIHRMLDRECLTIDGDSVGAEIDRFGYILYFYKWYDVEDSRLNIPSKEFTLVRKVKDSDPVEVELSDFDRKYLELVLDVKWEDNQEEVEIDEPEPEDDYSYYGVSPYDFFNPNNKRFYKI